MAPPTSTDAGPSVVIDGSAIHSAPATLSDLMDVQANVLDALAEGLGVIEAKIDALSGQLEALVASAAEASAMAQTALSGGLAGLLRGQK